MTSVSPKNPSAPNALSGERLVRISKYLSKHLRHQPECLGLTLGPGGWVAVDDLLTACDANGMRISRETLNEVVAQNDKKRFAFDETGTKIRANQGHSVEVDLMLTPQTPPDVLYHGTGQQSVEAIRREGLEKGKRHHVHLSPDTETATKVGARHGRPFLFTIDARAMHEAGYLFYRSENGVWLVDDVPPQFLGTSLSNIENQ
jgi:putative RNA 2'-phosphotransferase